MSRTRNNFIPDKLMVGKFKRDSSKSFLTFHRPTGSFLFSGDFLTYTGYSAVDKPRDSIIAFERDATDAVRKYDNVPTSGFKIGPGRNFRRERCVRISDPRGWNFWIKIDDFLHILNSGISLENGELKAQFVYSCINDEFYNIVNVNSEDYIQATKECEVKEKKRQLIESRKNMKLEEGVVYDYKIAGADYRCIYVGKMKDVVSDGLCTHHQSKGIPEKIFHQEKHVWLILYDSFTKGQYFSPELRFRTGMSNNMYVWDDTNMRPKRYHPLNMQCPLENRKNIWLMTFDDYVGIHSYEFSVANILATPTLDKVKIGDKSTNQSYKVIIPNIARAKLNPLYRMKKDTDYFQVPWTLDDIKTAIIKLSSDFYGCSKLY